MPPAADGKRRQVKRGGFNTEREARDALNDALSQLARGTFIEQRRLSVAEYLDEWLAGKESLRATTRRSYTEHITLYLKPGLGHVRLSDLRPADVEALYRSMRSLGTEDADSRDHLLQRLRDVRSESRPERPLTAARIHRVHATLHSALSTAKKRQMVALNVAEHVELPTAKRPKAMVWTADRVEAWQAGRLPRPKVAVWLPAHTGQFLDAIASDRLYALYHLIAFRGLRRGEAAGVPWTDVDLDAGALTVSQQIVQLGWATEIGEPKTDSGARVIALDAATVAVLKTHRAKQLQERLLWGEAWQNTGLVFTREDGTALHPDYITRHFERVTDKAKLPPIRLHDLRHGAATLALAGGADMKVVQAMLGHSSIALTADTYTAVLPEVAMAAAEAAAALVPRAAATADDGRVPNVCPEGAESQNSAPLGRTKGQVKPGGPPGDRTQNPRIKRT